MATFDPHVLHAIREHSGLRVAPHRADGVTIGTPTYIWAVIIDNAVIVRPYHGSSSRWYQAAMQQGTGAIVVDATTIDAAFEAAGDLDRAVVDAAYSASYPHNPYLAAMTANGPGATTVRISAR